MAKDRNKPVICANTCTRAHTHHKIWERVVKKKDWSNGTLQEVKCRPVSPLFTLFAALSDLFHWVVRVNYPDIYCSQSRGLINHLAHRDSPSEVQQQWALDFLLTYKWHSVLYAASTKETTAWVLHYQTVIFHMSCLPSPITLIPPCLPYMPLPVFSFSPSQRCSLANTQWVMLWLISYNKDRIIVIYWLCNWIVFTECWWARYTGFYFFYPASFALIH